MKSNRPIRYYDCVGGSGPEKGCYRVESLRGPTCTTTSHPQASEIDLKIKILASGPHNSLLCRIVGQVLNHLPDNSRCESRTTVPLRGNPAAVRERSCGPRPNKACATHWSSCAMLPNPSGWSMRNQWVRKTNVEDIVGRISRPARHSSTFP